jgi:predicted nucleotidyltransferase
MGQDTEKKILELYFENPSKKFTVREISRLSKLPKSTVHKYLLNLKKQNIISKDNRALDSLLFKTRKINYFVENIVSVGLLDEIIDKLNPSCIILFGSIRKGDSSKESDIDLFAETSLKSEIDFSIYEKRLKHKVQIFTENDIHDLQNNLLNNVVNGIKLYGSFRP